MTAAFQAPVIPSLEHPVQSGLDLAALWKTDPAAARRLQLMTEQRLDVAANNRVSYAEVASVADLSRINFPDRVDPVLLKDYGYQHHSETAKLAHRVGEFLGLSEHDLSVVKNAGMLHDLGRRTPWPGVDPGHQERSAQMADEAMRNDPIIWGDGKKRFDVCWVIANHRMDGPAPPTDPRLVALWDAECYEACRFAVGTREGIQAMKAGFERVITAWAKHEEYQRRWRAHRGWK